MRKTAPQRGRLGRALLAAGLGAALGCTAVCPAFAEDGKGPAEQSPDATAEARSASEDSGLTEASAKSPSTDTAPAVPPAAPDAIAAVEAHFAAISARDYRSAESWFSAAFLDAFKADVSRINEYYLARQAQLSRGFTVMESALLTDPGRQTARVTVDFNPPDPAAPVLVTERMHYYLIREKGADGTPGRDAEGRAWRIDIYDAFRHESLADARRRPYLYTRQAWPEDGGRELKSRQGLFRLQWALDSYAADRGSYPERLVGGDSAKDPLISGRYLTGAYPPNGWDNAAMVAVNLDERSSGDFTYIPLDSDGDGRFDDYWLLLHGKLPQSYYYEGTDIIYVLSAAADADQRELGQAFAAWWGAQRGQALADGPGLLALAPSEFPLPDGPAPLTAQAEAEDASQSASNANASTNAVLAAPRVPGAIAVVRGSAAAASVLRCRDRLIGRQLPADTPPEMSSVKAWLPGTDEYPPLEVWTYGLH